MGIHESNRGVHPMPIKVKIALAAAILPALVDTLFGLSTPQLQLARLLLAAGFSRRVDVFRQLLRLFSVLAIPGSCLVGAAKAAPVGMRVDVAAAVVTVVLLGSREVRSWCTPELGDHDGSATDGWSSNARTDERSSRDAPDS